MTAQRVRPYLEIAYLGSGYRQVKIKYGVGHSPRTKVLEVRLNMVYQRRGTR